MKRASIVTFLLIFVLTAGACSLVNEEPAYDALSDGANPDNELVALIESQGPGGTLGGEVEAPKFEGIQYGARYQRDLNIDPEKYKGRTLTLWTWWDIAEGSPEDLNFRNFEAATGCEVVYVNKQYSTYGSDLIKAIAAGEAPDICYFGSEVIPSYVKKGYLTPVSDYLDMALVQFEKSESVMDYFTFNGKLYVMPDKNPDSSKLYFRRDIFANASLPNPFELWQAGEWTWDRFIQLAQDVKQDLTGDGEYDIWGYYSWQQEQIFYSNGANYVQWVDGNPVEGLSDPKAIRAMEWQRALSDQYDIIAPWDPDSDPPGMLVKGSIAMMYWGDWLIDGLRDELGDKLGIAPFPIGPDAAKPMGDAAAATKEGLAGYCQEPELAALFLLFKRLPVDEADEAEKNEASDLTNITRYGSLIEYEMCMEMANYAVINPRGGFTGLGDVIDAIIGKDDMTPAQAVEAYKHVAQSRIDDTWDS